MSVMTLCMPSNYVGIEKDEMNYIEGGDGPITFHISSSVVNAAIGLGVTIAVSLACTIAGLTGFLATAVVPAVAGFVAAIIANGLLNQDSYICAFWFTGIVDIGLNAASGWDRNITLSI